MSTTTDRNQKLIMMALPFVFVIFVIQFPAGLLVYWITTNLWTIVQQAIVRKRLGPLRPPESAMAAVAQVDSEEKEREKSTRKKEKDPELVSSGSSGSNSRSQGRPAGPPPGNPAGNRAGDHAEGTFDDGTRWRIDTFGFVPPSETNPNSVVRIQLGVEWQGRNGPQQREITTYRFVPNPGSEPIRPLEEQLRALR